MADVLGRVVAGERREWQRQRDLTVAEMRAEIAEISLKMNERIDGKLAAIKDGEQGPQGPRGERGEQGERGEAGVDGPEGKQGIPGPPGASAELYAPDDVAPLIGRAVALLAEAPAIPSAQLPGPVVNVTVPPPVRSVERTRVTKHDERGRILEIERDVA